jgi:orotate phosphoribosyltransferase
MSYSAEIIAQSDIWASSTDTTTLRQKLLDLLCQVAYKEGDFTFPPGNLAPITLTVNQ